MTRLSYEDQRAQNIRDNEALLRSLGLANPPPQPKQQPRKLAPKRPADDDSAYSPPPAKLRRSGRKSAPLERSRRLSQVETDDEDSYSDEDEGLGYRRHASKGRDYQPQRLAQRLGIRTQNPCVCARLLLLTPRKRFGHIPGVPVGSWWESRMDCSTAAIHAAPVAGISGNSHVGAWSVALSGGYPDDVDLGEAFTYTGSGGRDLKGTKNAPKNLRTAPQTFDQSFDNNFNAALKKSADTRKPVRVIRGFKLDSMYAPATGYRYDGLYIVERAWMARGLTKGLLVCRYAFRRVAGQPPLPVRNLEGEVAEEEDAGSESEESKPREAEESNGEGTDDDPAPQREASPEPAARPDPGAPRPTRRRVASLPSTRAEEPLTFLPRAKKAPVPKTRVWEAHKKESPARRRSGRLASAQPAPKDTEPVQKGRNRRRSSSVVVMLPARARPQRSQRSQR